MLLFVPSLLLLILVNSHSCFRALVLLACQQPSPIALSGFGEQTPLPLCLHVHVSVFASLSEACQVNLMQLYAHIHVNGRMRHFPKQLVLHSSVQLQAKSCHKVGPQDRRGLKNQGESQERPKNQSKPKKNNKKLRSPGTLGPDSVTLFLHSACKALGKKANDSYPLSLRAAHSHVAASRKLKRCFRDLRRPGHCTAPVLR